MEEACTHGTSEVRPCLYGVVAYDKLCRLEDESRNIGDVHYTRAANPTELRTNERT
jgi:hypothetical protein